jgi:hypothetical protein
MSKPNPASITLAMINERAVQFWAPQSKLIEERAADEFNVAFALKEMSFDLEHGKPFREWSFATSLEKGEMAKRVLQRTLGARGGRAPKADSLQKRIEQIVSAEPNVSEPELRRRLSEEIGKGIITAIEPNDVPNRCIHFRTDNGTMKTAAVSGLKHRLSRAKAKKSSL